ncbi:MAG: VanZ family protein [Pseudomonadales bacterium]
MTSPGVRQAGLVALLAVLVTAQQFLRLPDHTQLLNGLVNLLHFPMFMGVAFFAWWICPAQWPKRRRVLVGIAVIFAVALLTELLQFITSGRPSANDLVTDLCAGLLTLMMLAAPSKPQRRLSGAILGITFLLIAQPVWLALLANRAIGANPEVLVPYDEPFTSGLIRCGCKFSVQLDPEEGPGFGSSSRLRLDFSDGGWKGLLFVDISRQRLAHAEIAFEFESEVALASLHVRARNQTEELEEANWRLPPERLDGVIVLPVHELVAQLPDAPYLDLLFHFELESTEGLLGEILFSRVALRSLAKDAVVGVVAEPTLGMRSDPNRLASSDGTQRRGGIGR